MEKDSTVFIVDDDPAVRESLSWLVETLNYPVETFESGQEFLDRYKADQPGCLVLDVRLPGMSGLKLQQKLKAENCDIPVIMISGHGDVPMAVRAVREGALNFLEKPFHDQEVLDCIQEALELDSTKRQEKRRNSEIKDCVERLTPREQQVMKRMVSGDTTRTIAEKYGISTKTVEVHRARVMEKMRAHSLPELVRLVLSLEQDQDYLEDNAPNN